LKDPSRNIKKAEQEDKEKDALLTNLSATLNVMRTKVNSLLKEKYDLKSDIENYQTLLRIEGDSYNFNLQRSQEYENKIKSYTERASQESIVFASVQHKVREHKESQTQLENEILNIFEAIDHMIS